MSTTSAHTDCTYSREEYRRWCDAQPTGRFERIDGRIVPMVPETGARLRMKAAIYMALDRAVRGAAVNCQALPDGATVETGDNDDQPDAPVICGAPMADDAIAAPHPVIIVEILSPSTASTDTGAKLSGHFRAPSVHPSIITLSCTLQSGT